MVAAAPSGGAGPSVPDAPIIPGVAENASLERVLPALVANPVLNVTLPTGESVSIPLKATTIGIQGEDGNFSFIANLTTDLLRERNPWFAVLRGHTPDSSVTSAVVLSRGEVKTIVNLPDGRSLRHPRPAFSSSGSGLALDSDGNLLVPVRPPFYIRERTVASPGSSAVGAFHLSDNADPEALDESIEVSSSIWKWDPEPTAVDPTNVIFYHKTELFASVLNDVGWADGGSFCGSSKDVKFFDARHGGEDAWKPQGTHWQPAGSLCGGTSRFHGRQYNSDTGDTHSPGFGGYAPFPVHSEDWDWWALTHVNVNPQHGQDKLLADLMGHPNIGTIWLYATIGGSCENCERWDGWFDLYQLTDGEANSCTEEYIGFISHGGDRPSVGWDCDSYPAAFGAFPIRDYALCESDQSPNHLAASGLGFMEYYTQYDQSYFYYTANIKTWGHDKDLDAAHSAVAQVAGRERADLYDATWLGGGSYTVEKSLQFDYVDVDFDGGETRVRVFAHFRTERASAGEWAAVRVYCFGTDLPTDEVRYHLWLTQNELSRGVAEVTVNFDPYMPADGYFSRYEVYYREDGQSTWNIGGSSTSQSTSSITVQNLDCRKVYHFKARVAWSGQSWANSLSDSPDASARPQCALWGFVTDSGTGGAIGGATVRASNSAATHYRTTSSSGYYEIIDIAPGTYTVESWRCDYYKESVSRTMGPDWTRQDFALSAKPQGTLYGYVTDSGDGSALSGATVRENLCQWSTTTNSNGYYSFTVVAAEQISVTASKSGYDSQTKYVTVPSGGSKRLDFSLTESGGGFGGSPFVAPWNGTEYALDNNLLPKSGIWDRETLNVDDYYRLHEPLVPKEGNYSLQVVEFEDEHTRLDQARLLTVDHDTDVQVAVDRLGNLYTFDDPEAPVFAVDNYGRDQLSVLSVEDGDHYEGWHGDFVTLGFGKVVHSEGRLLFKADFGHIFKRSVVVYVLSSATWQYVDTIHDRVRFAWEVVDLSDYLPSDDLVVRLSTTKHHRIDFVGLDASRQRGVHVEEAPLLRAVHSESGEVLDQLTSTDGQYVNITPGQQVTLTFGIPIGLDENRSFVFVSVGYYTHKYQPYIGEDLAIENLTLRAAALLAEETEVFTWDVDVAFLVWHMGDGTLLDGWFISHTYMEPGEYKIRIEMHYDDGRMVSVERRIVVAG